MPFVTGRYSAARLHTSSKLALRHKQLYTLREAKDKGRFVRLFRYSSKSYSNSLNVTLLTP